MNSDPTRAVVNSPGAPAAVGPYSHAVRHGNTLYCSGAIPVDPEDGSVVSQSPAAETRRCLENLSAVCESAGTNLGNALRLTIYTTDLDSFPEINEAYGEFFAGAPPARGTVGVSALALGVKVEIDAIVAMG